GRTRVGRSSAGSQSRLPYYWGPFGFYSNDDGTFKFIAWENGQIRPIPRAPFDLWFYHSTGPATVSTHTVGDFPSTGVIDLTSVSARAMTASSSYPNVCCGTEMAADGRTDTGWASAPNDPAAPNPWLQASWPSDVPVHQVKIRGSRVTDDYGIRQARVDVRDAAGNVLWTTDVDLPLPYRDTDVDVPTGTPAARAVRLTVL